MKSSNALPPRIDRKNQGWQSHAQHAFFTQVDALLAAHDALSDGEQAALEYLRLQLLHQLRAELPVRKQQLGILTFDDLLLHLRDALEQHPDFPPRLALKYQAALIDEFQDTDPIQYEIFERIYRDKPEQPVFYVGDPKQAIYGFRGRIFTPTSKPRTARRRTTRCNTISGRTPICCKRSTTCSRNLINLSAATSATKPSAPVNHNTTSSSPRPLRERGWG